MPTLPYNSRMIPTMILVAFAALTFADIASGQDEFNRRADKKETQRQRGEIEVTEVDLYWQALDTHLTVDVAIYGKDFKWEKQFTEGTAPEFNSLREDIKPGIYDYRVTFTPNKVTEEKSAIKELKSQHYDLAGELDQAIESGDSDAVKRLSAQVKDVRNQSAELNAERSKKTRKDYGYIERQGQFIIDEDGILYKYDRVEAQKQHREKIMEERRQRPRTREEDPGREDF